MKIRSKAIACIFAALCIGTLAGCDMLNKENSKTVSDSSEISQSQSNAESSSVPMQENTNSQTDNIIDSSADNIFDSSNQSSAAASNIPSNQSSIPAMTPSNQDSSQTQGLQELETLINNGTIESEICTENGENYLSSAQLSQTDAYKLLNTYNSVGTFSLMGSMNYGEPTASALAFIKNGVQTAIFTNENGYTFCHLFDGLHSYSIFPDSKRYTETDDNTVTDIPDLLMNYFKSMQICTKYKVTDGYAEVFKTPEELAYNGITEIKTITGSDNGYDVLIMKFEGTNAVKNYVLRFEAAIDDDYKNIFNTDFLSDYTRIDS